MLRASKSIVDIEALPAAPGVIPGKGRIYTKTGEEDSLFYQGPSGAEHNMVSGFSGMVEAVNIIIDGGGSAIADGEKGHIALPYAGRVVEWKMLGSETGSFSVDLYKDTFANFPPTVVDSMVGAGTKPNLTSQQKNNDASVDWDTVNFSAGDIIGFSGFSGTTAAPSRVTLALKIQRT